MGGKRGEEEGHAAAGAVMGMRQVWLAQKKRDARGGGCKSARWLEACKLLCILDRRREVGLSDLNVRFVVTICGLRYPMRIFRWSRTQEESFGRW